MAARHDVADPFRFAGHPPLATIAVFLRASHAKNLCVAVDALVYGRVLHRAYIYPPTFSYLQTSIITQSNYIEFNIVEL